MLKCIIDAVAIANKMVAAPISSWWYVCPCRFDVFLFMAFEFKLLKSSSAVAILLKFLISYLYRFPLPAGRQVSGYFFLSKVWSVCQLIKQHPHVPINFVTNLPTPALVM